MSDMVNHPSHYETGKFECIDVMLETQGKKAVQDFCICNAFKYLYRHANKNGTEDVEKARWYINKYLELEESEMGTDKKDEGKTVMYDEDGNKICDDVAAALLCALFGFSDFSDKEEKSSDRDAGFKEIAETTFSIFKAFVVAGFTEEQAMSLTKFLIFAGVKGADNEG